MALPVDERYCYRSEGFGTMQSFRTFPHSGDDWARKKTNGQPIQAAPDIYAVFAGTVRAAGWHAQAGYRTVIQYWFGRVGIYAHQSKILVAVGQSVREGQLIGYLGGTGKVTGPHLHYSQHTSLEKALSGYFQYWFRPGTRTPMWSSVNAWAAASGLIRPDYRVGSKAHNPKAPDAPQTPTEEEELMSIMQELKEWFQGTLNAAEIRIKDELRGEVRDRITTAESRMRADTRGFITLDMGSNPWGDIADAAHAVYIGHGEIQVFEPPAKVGIGQIKSHLEGTEEKGSDYRLVDQKRPTNRMTSGKFWNAVKDALTRQNYFGDDRQVTVQQAKDWVAKHERLKAEQQ